LRLSNATHILLMLMNLRKAVQHDQCTKLIPATWWALV
jgi:hypothetical protein